MPGIPTTSPTSPAIPAIPHYWRFPAELASVPRARRALAEVLPRACRPQLSYELRLLASELVTNAIRHGARTDRDEVVELLFWTADHHHWLAVCDPSPRQPVPTPTAPAPDPQACGGRGLLLVDALCDVWAVVPRRTRGKAVVAGVRLPRP
ncbi:ATP-binding protein [Kitasatospora nipponensis]|uniref:ATP-binding protein n=1 Tax=Kitasatospora nipponensis TaxID=258049 RepID=A0ABN1W567_9ACTN